MQKEKYIYMMISPIVIIILWQCIYTMHLFSTVLFPSLQEILPKVYLLLTSYIGYINIWHTLWNAFLWFMLATILGIPIGLWLGFSQKAYRSNEIMLHFFRSLPATAIFPIFLLFFGINDSSKIAISCFISLWIIILASSSGVLYSNAVRIKTLHMLWVHGFELYKQLFYNSLSHIYIGLRTASAMTLIVVIVTEVFVGSSYGIGQNIYDAYVVYDTITLFARVIITWIIWYSINLIMTWWEKYLIHRNN